MTHDIVNQKDLCILYIDVNHKESLQTSGENTGMSWEGWLLVKHSLVAIDVRLDAELLGVGKHRRPHLAFLFTRAENTPICRLHHKITQ